MSVNDNPKVDGGDECRSSHLLNDNNKVRKCAEEGSLQNIKSRVLTFVKSYSSVFTINYTLRIHCYKAMNMGGENDPRFYERAGGRQATT